MVNQTRNRILDAALAQMLERGYTATSLDEVCQAAGVTKGALFHHFKSKEDLAQAVMGHFAETMGQAMAKGPHLQIEDPLERTLAYCDHMVALVEAPDSPQSCIFGNFSQELAPSHPEFQARCGGAFAHWSSQIKADLEAAARQYPTRSDFDAAGIAEHLISVYEGSLILAKAQGDPSVVRRNVAHFKRYLSSQFASESPDSPSLNKE